MSHLFYLQAKKAWKNLDQESRSTVLLKIPELIAGPREVQMAISSALEVRPRICLYLLIDLIYASFHLQAKKAWKNLDQESRSTVLLKIAELIAGPMRSELLASTMLNQSKNFFQAEIDATCESIDFLRFNCHFVEQLAAVHQPASSAGVWNRLGLRPLEGFVYVVSPFNFTSIAMNLCTGMLFLPLRNSARVVL